MEEEADRAVYYFTAHGMFITAPLKGMRLIFTAAYNMREQ